MSIKATKAMLNPNTFKTEAVLNRRSTLMKFRKIVFIPTYLFYSLLRLSTGFAFATRQL